MRSEPLTYDPSVQLTRYIRVQLIWVPGHESVVVNAVADQVANWEPNVLYWA